jgi:hypothetical protein
MNTYAKLYFPSHGNIISLLQKINLSREPQNQSVLKAGRPITLPTIHVFNTLLTVKPQVLTAASMKMTAFLDTELSSLVEVDHLHIVNCFMLF